MFLDLAIAWDARRRRCDLVYQGGRLQLDRTPVTPMLISLGCERRARPDDTLPDAVTEGSIAASAAMNPRRGWSGDGVAAAGAGGTGRVGSRLWLLERAKLTDETLLDAQDDAVEACAWIGTREGLLVEAAASIPASNVMLLQVAVGTTTIPVRLRVGA